MKALFGRLVLALVAVAGLTTISCGQESASELKRHASDGPAAEWPAYRRDSGLTGFSPLVGGLAEAPQRIWTHDLGGAMTNTEQAQLIDLNGDGRDELLRVLSDRLICQSVQGEQLWETERLAGPEVLHIRDFAGRCRSPCRSPCRC